MGFFEMTLGRLSDSTSEGEWFTQRGQIFGYANRWSDNQKLGHSIFMPTKFPHVSFLVNREYLDAEGIWNPRDEDPAMEGGFQINVFGTRDHYLRLADAIRQFAEQDTSNDGDYHEHFEGVFNSDGKVRLHIILRKDDVGDGIYKKYYPKNDAMA